MQKERGTLNKADETMIFEWDPKKERDNIINHGIPFSVAAQRVESITSRKECLQWR
jgi:hypothetical protein